MEKNMRSSNWSGSSPSRSKEGENVQIDTTHWNPGYAARFPWTGAMGVLSVFLCAAIIVIVLVLSDHRSSTVWKLQPSIIIQGLNSLSNFFLAMVIVEAVSIAWWRKAVRGATVAELHQSWAFSHSFTNILRHFRNLDTIALAAVAAKLAIADGVLFQRATSTYTTQDPPGNVSILGAAAQSFPETGFVVAQGFGAQTDCDCFMIGDTYTPTVDRWEKSNGFFTNFHELFPSCDGICYSFVDAIGFEIDCQKSSDHTDIAKNAISAYNRAGGSGNSSQWSNLPIFNSSFGMAYPDATKNYPRLTMNLYYFDSDNPYDPNPSSCPGTVTNVTCQLRPALVRYPLTVVNYTNVHITNGISIGSNSSDNSNTASPPVPNYSYSNKQAEGFEVLSYLDVNDQNVVNSTSHLGGIANALSQFESSSAAITYTNSSLWSLTQKGILSQSMMFGPPNMGSCDCSFKDALSTLVSAVNQLSFLTATSLIARPLPDNIQDGTRVTVSGVNQNTTATFNTLPNTLQISDVIHYQTNYLFMGLGIGTMLIALLLTLPAFWRYGELGRAVTLGPMEIASAFRAPMFETGRAGEHHSGDLDQLIRRVGDRKVVYGLVEEEKSSSNEGGNGPRPRQSLRLAIEQPDRVTPLKSTFKSPVSIKSPSSTLNQPPTSPLYQPLASSFNQPPTSSFQQPPASSFQQPPMSSSHQPPTSSFQQPPTSSSHQPLTSSFQQPPTSSLPQPPTSSFQQLHTSSSHQAPISSFYQPPTSSFYQPYTSSEDADRTTWANWAAPKPS